MFWKSKKTEEVPFVRPCLVDGQPAWFHCWAADDTGLLKINGFFRPKEEELARYYQEQGIVPSSCSLETLRRAVALVEFPDGSVGKAQPELIQFLDREGG